MKQIGLTFGILMLGIALYAQADAVLFRVGNKVVAEKEIRMLTSGKDKELSIDDFNLCLNFYLSIYDFKAQKKDTTKVFKRSLEAESLRMLGSVYSAENNDSLLNKCSVSHRSFAVVRDLFVPFEPELLRNIEAQLKAGISFEKIAKDAQAYEGVQESTQIITPVLNSWTFNNAACELLSGKKTVGPVKDAKGYHYLHFLREQENFGTYKTQVIYISDVGRAGAKKIKQAEKALHNQESFCSVMKKISEGLRNQEDDGIRYFSPSINTDKVIQTELSKLEKDGDVSAPFLASRGWYIIKRLSKDSYPSKEILKRNVRVTTQKPSFFIDELKEKYGAKEYPQNFLSGKDDILFVVGTKAYYAEDLKQYVEEYGYNYSSESYDQFYIHVLLEKYKEELDGMRYQELLEDFYFMQIHNPMDMLQSGNNPQKFVENLRKLVKKYKPEIPNKKYVEGNPVFEK